jgi:hypothetical protein
MPEVWACLLRPAWCMCAGLLPHGAGADAGCAVLVAVLPWCCCAACKLLRKVLQCCDAVAPLQDVAWARHSSVHHSQQSNAMGGKFGLHLSAASWPCT